MWVILFLNESELICFHTSITIVCTQLNGSKYKNLFLRRKSGRPRPCLGLAGVEKGEVIPYSAAPKNYLLFLSRTTIEPSVRIRRPNWKISQQMGFVTRFLNGEIKPKSNESTNSGTKLKAWKLKPPERFRHSLLE